MVEGPGCALCAERLRARLRRGQRVRAARGGGATAASKEKISGHDFLVGHVYRGVETLGKELFMYFDEKALRNAAECEQKVRMMESLDVCSPKFSFSRAEREIKQQNTRMLCDVLLDQAVLPGVGNIIKNEALFDSGLHPALKVCQLTDEHIRHLVKMTRDFTLLFYKCRKAGSALYPHYKVYKRPACRECSGSITVCRLGDHNRMTYFCSRCQKADPQLVNLSKLPARNSLIGWAYGRGSCSNEHVARKSEEEWTCMCCTLINKPSAEICDACLTSRPEVPKMESFEESAAFNTNLMKYPCNDFRKPSTEIKINRKTAFGTTTLVLTDLGNKTVLRNDIQVSGGQAQCDFPKSNACQSGGSTDKECSTHVTALALSSCQQPVSFKHIQKKQKTDHVPLVHPYNRAISAPQTNVRDDARMLSVGHPRCSKHSRLCSLRVVRKDGENKGRQFYCCPLSRETRCDYFQWADLDFPFCNHGKRCVMKTVLKIGPNNGKNFFVCPLEKEKQCGFFQWAKNGPGMQILP
ncbi:endonuclease 8-like 3 isoform X2 [Passer montanus]|uniref:endonuclease 8-like 3 isoform X2 n=1 Tax=Passer montanus TaxID=9160 RepID=UPI00195FDCED|nr:endonuclease 8-like 3 isoform X2 [Passer montanus]